MLRPTRWGILGSGVVAADFARGLRSVPGAELRAVASRSRAHAERLASAFGAARVHDTSEALVEDREVDIVYVATPNHLHKPHTLLALGAKKAVLCEKPFALDAGQAREMIQAARAQGVFCMEAMWMRFLPAIREAKALLDSGFAGEVRFVSASLGFTASGDPAHRLYRPDMGGGALLDLGVYPVSLVHMVLGAPTSVVSSAVTGATGVDEQFAAVLGFEGGAQAVVSASLRAPLPSDAEIVGARGSIHVHAPLYRPHELSVAELRGASAAPTPRLAEGALAALMRPRWIRASALRASGILAALGFGRKTILRAFEGNGYNYEAAEAMRCLAEGRTESAVLPLQETLRVQETLDAIRRAWA